MTRTMRFSSAALGMVLLAGLAYYQGDADFTRSQQEILTGTVLTEAARKQENDCEKSPDAPRQETGNCAAEPASDGADG